MIHNFVAVHVVIRVESLEVIHGVCCDHIVGFIAVQYMYICRTTCNLTRRMIAQ